MQIITKDGSSSVITGQFVAGPEVANQILVINGGSPQPWLTIDRIDQDSGHACKPIQARLCKTNACLTVTLPLAHTGVVVVKDAAGNTLFTTETPK